MPEYGGCAKYGVCNRVKIYKKSIHIIQIFAKGKPYPEKSAGTDDDVKKMQP
jgi:hypothetical protein